MAEFVLKYPAIALEVDLSARFVDLIGENFDVAIRMGDLRDDASLAATLQEFLAREGYRVEVALSAAEALAILHRKGEGDGRAPTP